MFLPFHNITHFIIGFEAITLVSLIHMSMGADDDLVHNLGIANNVLSLATNMVATALIGYVYW